MQRASTRLRFLVEDEHGPCRYKVAQDLQNGGGNYAGSIAGQVKSRKNGMLPRLLCWLDGDCIVSM
ncbi:MAG: hypothetical protein ACLU80_02225 [Dorea sp.]